MKAQIIPFVFMILLMATITIGYVYYNTFYGTEYKLQVYYTRVIDAVRNIIEDFKNYLYLSLTFSSHQSLREHACKGGLIGALPWICNGPNPVKPEASKACLEKYTKYYLNVYNSLFNTSLPVQLSKVNFTGCVYDVNTNEIWPPSPNQPGKYDEGNFWVNCSGAKITISGTNVKEFENIDSADYITKNRYWYLFRNFYDWANHDVYSGCVCGNIGCACGSGAAEEVCGTGCSNAVESCAQAALADLRSRFDQDVVCDMRQQCCAQGVGPLCGSPCGCQAWENHICQTGCEHECKEPPQGHICPGGTYGSPYLGTSSKSPFTVSAQSTFGKCCCAGSGGGAYCTDSCYYDCSAKPCTSDSDCFATTTSTKTTSTAPPTCFSVCSSMGYSTSMCVSSCPSGCVHANAGDANCNPYSCCCCQASTTTSPTTTTTGTTTTSGTTTTTNDGGTDLCHYEARLAASYRFWCVDNKYNVPSDVGPVPLTFVAYAIAFWRDPCACCTTCTPPGCGC